MKAYPEVECNISEIPGEMVVWYAGERLQPGFLAEALQYFKDNLTVRAEKVVLHPGNAKYADELPKGVSVIYCPGCLAWEVWLWAPGLDGKKPRQNPGLPPESPQITPSVNPVKETEKATATLAENAEPARNGSQEAVIADKRGVKKIGVKKVEAKGRPPQFFNTEQLSIIKNPEISLRDAAEMLGVSHVTVRAYRMKLEAGQLLLGQ